MVTALRTFWGLDDARWRSLLDHRETADREPGTSRNRTPAAPRRCLSVATPADGEMPTATALRTFWGLDDAR